MNRVVFYSWQSDLPSKGNRNIIEDGLKRALKAIKKDEKEHVEPVLDRDTNNVPGSPDITDSIFMKISSADIFVADVSVINKNSMDKNTSNPNVLIELGFAISQLGWDRIILVQNNFFGGPEELPFDLRGRRVVTYTYEEGKSEKSNVLGILQGRLENALKSALNDSSFGTLPTGYNAPIWWGDWFNYHPGRSFGGTLFIRETTSSGFIFDLDVHSGAHLGHVTAEAIFVSRDLAYARITNGPDNPDGEISFRRTIENGKRFLQIEETASCLYHHGMGVSFTGIFQWSPDHLFELGYINELELERIYNTIGNHYHKFKSAMEMIYHSDNHDAFEAKVFSGGIRGMFTTIEGIVMCGTDGEIWLAYLDEGKVYYFTNVLKWRNNIPKTIDIWRNRFPDALIEIVKEVNTLPINIH